VCNRDVAGPYVLQHAVGRGAVEVAAHEHGHGGGGMAREDLVPDGLEAGEAHAGLEQADVVRRGAEVQVGVAHNQDLVG